MHKRGLLSASVPHKRALLSVLTALAMLIPGVTVLTAQTAQAAPPPSSIKWQPCVENPVVECAHILVPKNYSDPKAGTLKMRVARSKATDPGNRIGSLFFNPGGPGVSGVEYLLAAGGASLISPEVASRFDIVAFDPRGTDVGINCLSDSELERYWETSHLPVNNAETKALLELERKFNEACVAKNSSLVQHVSTANVVRDIEYLRVALNESSISFFGYSYGTFMAQMYAQKYPGKLRATVLDGVVDRTISDRAMFRDQVTGFEGAWDEFKSWCASNVACRLKGHDIDGVLKSTLEKARANPIPAPRAAIVGDTRPVNEWALTIAVQSMVATGRVGYMYVDTIISEAASGDASWARILYAQATGYMGGGTYFDGEGTSRTIRCLDTSWSQRVADVADVERLTKWAESVSPLFGEADVWQGPAQCHGFPLDPVDPPPNPVKVKGQAPALLVSATNDPQTPLKWATHIAKKYDNESLLLRDGNGHTSYQFSRCVQQKVDRYLIDLQLPEWGTVCNSDLDQTQPPPELSPAQASTGNGLTQPEAAQLPTAALQSLGNFRNRL